MALAIVQSKLVAGTGSSVSSENYSFDSNITAGNLILVLMRPVYGGTHYRAFTIQDSAARALTELTAARATGGFAGLYDMRAYYYENHPGGITQIQMIDSLDTFNSNFVWLLEVSGTSVRVDTGIGNTQSTAGTGTDGVTSTTLTPATTTDLLFGYTSDVDDNGGTLSDGTGFSPGVNSTSMIRGESKQLASSSAVAATFTHTVAATHLTTAVAIKELILSIASMAWIRA